MQANLSRPKNTTRPQLATKLAQRGYVKSARALIAREPAGAVIVIEVNLTEGK